MEGINRECGSPGGGEFSRKLAAEQGPVPASGAERVGPGDGSLASEGHGRGAEPGFDELPQGIIDEARERAPAGSAHGVAHVVVDGRVRRVAEAPASSTYSSASATSCSSPPKASAER